MSKSNINQNGDVKEEFCGVCAVVPALFIGTGTIMSGSSSSDYKKKRKLQIIGIIITVISLVMIFVYLRRCKECKIKFS